MDISEGIVRNGRSEIIDAGRVPVVTTSESGVEARNIALGNRDDSLAQKSQAEAVAQPASEAPTDPTANATTLQAIDQAATAHLNANLPSYVQAATEVANKGLQPRLGEQVPVTKKAEGVVGYTEVTLVEPARHPQDVAPLPPASPAPTPGPQA